MDYSKFRLRNFTKLRSTYVLECGSYLELPLKYCAINKTDTDIIYYYSDICAIPWNRNPPKNTKCTVLRIDSKQTPPGFARLMVDRNNTEDNPTYFRRPPCLRDIITGGPSIQTERILTGAGQSLPDVHVYYQATQTDNVTAVYCPYWPVEAEEWRKRKRFHGWPNEKLIARITRGGCHFVSKLRTWSSSDDTEWRFSFSKAELLLIHGWTPDQKYAYNVIRIIKRGISEFCGGDGNKGLQTYFFKTLMFWACEEFPPEFWHKQNANTYIKTLFRRFLRCLNEKFCPNYFIPQCNIMSHLKHEASFDIVSQMVQEFLTTKLSSIAAAAWNTSQDKTTMYGKPIECVRIAMFLSCPLNEELNGRLAQYLSECEWFSPEMRNLHAAIEAQLRLMSLDSVIERQTSKDYDVCLENFVFSLSKPNEFEPYERLNTDKSFPENWTRIFIRKLLRNSDLVYYRMNHSDDTFHKMNKESFPPLLHGATSAYRANFYFTAMRSYNKARIECEKCFEVHHNKAEIGVVYHRLSDLGSNIPLLMCNRLSQIFDEHLQVILGFATLHRNITFSNSQIIIATSHEVCLKMDAWEFLKYLYIQCEQKLYSKFELTDFSFPVNSDLYQTYMSQLMDNAHYSAAILFAALRQSRAYKNSLMGRLIPDHISHRRYQRLETIQKKHNFHFH